MEDKRIKIMKRLEEHKKFAEEQGLEVVCVMLQGSQNYGLDIYTEDYMSDIDTKAIILPRFDDFCRMKDPVSTTLILPNDEHCDCKDVRVMFRTFEKQNINFVEILFSEYYIINPKYYYWVNKLLDMADEVAKINWNQALNCMAGMSSEKLVAMEHPYPTIKDKIDKYGYDPKQLHHILRMNDFIKKFVSGKPYRECLVPDNPQYLMDIKSKPIPLVEARELAVKTDKETHDIKNKYLKEDNEINYATIEKLQNISFGLIKQYIKEQIMQES